MYGRQIIFEGLLGASLCEISLILRERVFSLRLMVLLRKGMEYPLPKRISLIKFISLFMYELEQIFRTRPMREVTIALLTYGGGDLN